MLSFGRESLNFSSKCQKNVEEILTKTKCPGFCRKNYGQPQPECLKNHVWQMADIFRWFRENITTDHCFSNPVS
jgi:hypothetical protein